MKSSHKIMLQWLILLVAIASILFVYQSSQRENNKIPLVKLHDSFQPVSLTSLFGEKVVLQAEQGKPMLINLWATWCKPCVNELPLLNEVQQFVPEVSIIAVNMGESADTISPFRERYDLTMPILLDKDLIVKQMFNAVGYPLSVFVDGDGKVVSIHQGEITDFNELLAQLKGLVGTSS